MSRAELATLWLLVAVGGGSGLALGIMKYLLPPPDDPFSVVSHPWQPAALHAHVLGASLLALTLGWVLASHARPRYRLRAQAGRRSGVWSALVTVPMVLTGSLIQVMTEPSLVRGAAVVHLLLGIAFVAAALTHLAATLPVARHLRSQRAAARQETA